MLDDRIIKWLVANMWPEVLAAYFETDGSSLEEERPSFEDRSNWVVSRKDKVQANFRLPVGYGYYLEAVNSQFDEFVFSVVFYDERVIWARLDEV